MKTIREIQYDKVKELYRRLLKFRDEKPDMATLEKLTREVMYSTLRTPMSGKYRLPRHDSVDVESLNVELGLVKADAETIYDYLDEIQKRLRTLRYVSDVWQQNAKKKVNNTLIELAKLTSPVFIDGFTEILDPVDIMNQSETTLVVDEEGTITLPMIVNKTRSYTYKPEDVSLRRIGNGLTATVMGTLTDLVSKYQHGMATLTLEGNVIQESGFKIEINTDVDAINHIYLQLADVRTGIKVKVETSSNKIDYVTQYEEVVVRNRIDIPISETDLKKVHVTLTMSNPNIVLVDKVKYQFKVEKILLLSDKRKLTGIYQTNAIALEEDIAFVSLAVDDETVGNCEITYYIASEVDSAGEPVGFSYIDPNLFIVQDSIW